MSSATTPRRRLGRLSTRLLTVMLVLTIIPVVILTVVPTVVEAQREIADRDARLGEQADIRVKILESWVTSTQSSVRDIINDADIRPLLNAISTTQVANVPDQQSFTERTTAIVQTGRLFDEITLVNLQGKTLASSNKSLVDSGFDFSHEPWLTKALKNPGEVISVGPLVDPSDNEQSLYFAITIRSTAGAAPQGVLVGRVPVSALESTLLTIPVQTTDRRANTEYYLVRAGQQYVVRPLGDQQSALATDEILSVALSGKNGQGTWKDYRGVNVTGAYRWIGMLDMALIAKQDTTNITADLLPVIQLQVITGLVAIILVIAAAIYLSRRFTSPLEQLSDIATRISRGDMTLQAPPADAFEFNQLAEAFNRMTGRLSGVLEKQDETIQSRTRQLELTAQIGRVLAAENDLTRLMRITINMIREQLGFYHAQIFMLDDLHQYAVLRESTGSIGQELLRRGHKLAVASQSVIGQVTSRGEPILVRDTDASPVHHKNELLPDTRAELAVPLRVGDEIIGALDVQSVEADVFDEATIASFRTIADQLAVAIRNAQLFEEKEGLLSASLQLTQTLTRDNWDTYLSQRKQPDDATGFRYDLSTVKPVESGDGGGNGHGVRAPIALRGEVIGEMMAQMPEGESWSDDQKQLVGQVLDRVALALENARLFEQTQLSLAEANRLYQASQAIAHADSVPDLVNNVLGLTHAEAVDRSLVILREEALDPESGQWVAISGRWSRSAQDALTLPERGPIEQYPVLYQLEKAIPPDGWVINLSDKDLSGLDGESRTLLSEAGVRSMAIFPLNTGGRTLGWLMMHSIAPKDAFTEPDRRFFAALSDQAATALEGLRLFEQAQIRLRRVQATNEVSRAASSILNPDILLPLTVDKISEAFNYYHTQIFLVDDFGEWATLKASTGEVGQELLRRGHKLQVGSQSVIGQVTSRGEPVIARDTDVDAIHKRNELLPNTRAEMAIPLKTGDRVIGALDVQSTLPNAFDPEAQVILQSLADQISVTLENAQLFQEIQDRVAELTTVNLISQAVSRAETLEDLYDVVAFQLQRTFGAQHALLAVLKPDDIIEVPIFLEGGELLPPIAPIPMGQGLTSHVIRTREVLVINRDLEEEAKRLGARVIGVMPKSLLAVPLLLGDDTVGVISIQDAEKENAYNETHIRQLTTLAAYIAIKIRNAELLEEAQRRASELGFLFNVTRAAVAASTLDDALNNVVKILQDEIAGTDAAVVYLTEADTDKLHPHAAIGYGADIVARYPELELSSNLVKAAISGDTPIAIADMQAQPEFAGFDNRTHAAALVPLKAGQELTGVLMAASLQSEAFGEGQLRLLEAISGTLTAIIQNNRLLEQITRANDQLRELDKLKSQFLANMSHELRTPLNSIIGFSRVMLKGIDGALNDLQTQDLTTIYNSGQHLLGLINDILDVSKIEAGKMEIQPEYIGLEEIIDGVMSTGKGLIKEKPIQIFKEVEASLPQVWGDPVRIRQVLLNLVSNASKFTTEGSITIRATHKHADRSTGEFDRVQVDVQDTGIGIAEDDMAKVFEAFRQVDGSTTRQVGGTGLGLSISRQFIEMHGGKMWVTSQVGSGSTFSFTVPLHPPTLERSEMIVNTRNGGGLPLVLAVDDEPGVLELYSRYLEKGGYAIVGFNNANDLLENIREHQPAAVVLDLNLPGMDGWEAISEVKKVEEFKSLPIIVCSIEDQRERGRTLGVNAYLIKPIVEEDFIRAVEQVTSKAPHGGMIRKVLIVDSDQTYSDTMRQAIENTGDFSARVVGVGYEGINEMMKHRPDAVILDMELPDMDGYGLLTAIRSQPETKDTPVLIVSNREVTPDDLARVDATHTYYLSKSGITPDQLLSKLAEVLSSPQTTA